MCLLLSFWFEKLCGIKSDASSLGPVIDDAYVTKFPAVALASGQFQPNLSLVVGHNAAEVQLYLDCIRFTLVLTFFLRGFSSPFRG